MITANDATKVFDTVLSIPGMNETVKMDLKISRKNVLAFKPSDTGRAKDKGRIFGSSGERKRAGKNRIGEPLPRLPSEGRAYRTA
ncbi:hypothetical protein ACQ9BO_09320 [Flavobacterium sp. P21]|uniref:hypothetical protein n=1 Tax=Flavobacterium sp. P21 TaxID=3423948 RepID=UPI003D663CE9